MKGRPCPYQQIICQEGYCQDYQIYRDRGEGAEMTEANRNRGKGCVVKNCPIHLTVCYPSCYFWMGKCSYDQIILTRNGKDLCENTRV